MPTNKPESTSTFKQHSWLLVAGGVLIVVILVLVVLLIIKYTQSTDKTQDIPPPISADIDRENPAFLQAGLISLNDCETVLDYYKENALKKVTAWGLDDGRYFIDEALVETSDVALDSSEAQAQTTSSSTPSHSTTNIQVAGVDEADIVKTDGNYLYILSQETLKVIDVRQTDSDNPPVVVAEVDIDFYATDMLLSLNVTSSDDLNDALIIIGRSDWYQLRLVQIDIDNRQSPKITADFKLDGDYIGMRLTDNTVRLVTSSVPLGFDWEYPSGSGLRSEARALVANKEIIRNSELNNWIPAYQDNLKPDSEPSSFINCSQMLAPPVFSGLNTLSIATFNASKPLTAESWQALGLAADGQNIYANADHVYVATTEIMDEADTTDSTTASDAEELTVMPQIPLAADLETIIHKFGASKSANQPSTANSLDINRPLYLASGKVTGTLLNQFSMDEYEGDLRVAVTIEDFDNNTSENHIKILRPNRGLLEEIGEVTGLGIDERIFAVRFMGPQAYIVTFRQIDPLYALDLSDPTNPQALGELKITGFSSYLHPVGDNLLLGIGQEADEEGRIEGLQLSLFDTSQATDPQRISQMLLSDILELNKIDDIDLEALWGYSAAENDHRAFLFYEEMAYVPYNITWHLETNYDWGSEAGILMVTIEDDALAIANILKAQRPNNTSTDKESYLQPERTVVVDDVIYGITQNGVVIAWQLADGELLHILDD